MFREVYLFVGFLLILFLSWRFLTSKMLIDHSRAFEPDKVYRLKPWDDEAKANPAAMKRFEKTISDWADPYALAANILLVFGSVGGFMLVSRKPDAITQKKMVFLLFWILALAFAGSMLKDFSGNNEIGFLSIVSGYANIMAASRVHMITGHGAYYSAASSCDGYVGYVVSIALLVVGGYLCYFFEQRKRRKAAEQEAKESSGVG